MALAAVVSASTISVSGGDMKKILFAAILLSFVVSTADAKRVEFDGTKMAGDWAAGTAYVQGDIVSGRYLCWPVAGCAAGTEVTNTSYYVDLKGAKGDTGTSSYTYVAYASDDSGTDFTTTFDADLNYIAIKVSATAIETPAASDFTGLWKNVKGAAGSKGDTGTVSSASGISIPQGTSGQYFELLEGSGGGTNKVTVSAPATLAADVAVNAAYLGKGTKCVTINAATASSDFLVERFPMAITINAVHVMQLGATNVIGGLDECDGNGANCAAVDSDITAESTNANDDGTLSNPSIDAGDWIQWHTTSVSGTNTQVGVCFDYTVN